MAEPTYSYRPHALAPERHYRLEPDALGWSTKLGQGRVAYRDIERVEVFQTRFLGSSSNYWTCVLHRRSGGRIKLGAGHWRDFRTVEDRSETYFAFDQALRTRLVAANPNLRVIAGHSWLGRAEEIGGMLGVRLTRRLRRFDLDRTADWAGWLMRKIGPWLRGHRRAGAQIAKAFPEKSPAEIEQILSGMWDNLGRVGAEYVHLDRIWDFKIEQPNHGRIVLDEATLAQYRQLTARRGPALMFGAHVGNWEVSALAAQLFVPNVSVIYKSPRVEALANEIERLRQSSGAELLSADRTTTLKIRDALKHGHMVGMLVDQHYAGGVEVTMFNRPFKVNPLFARFVRIFECPFHGFRIIRLPNGRMRLDITQAIEPAREPSGRVDVAGTMQVIVSTVEGWVREHPEQWLWLLRLWR